MEASKATDWNLYYQQDIGVARFTRKITQRKLIAALRKYSVPNPVLAEIGGAASCVFDAVQQEIAPAAYHVIDTNEYGLKILNRRAPGIVQIHNQSVLEMNLSVEVDTVFSLGLIEHFDVQGTKQAILGHLDILKCNGIAVISFPTPTLLYRVTRSLIEAAGHWIFHDERPLWPAEAEAAVEGRATVLSQQLIWPIMLTQSLMVFRKC